MVPKISFLPGYTVEGGSVAGLSGKAMGGGGMKLEKRLVSGLSWWAGIQDTALQTLSFPA